MVAAGEAGGEGEGGPPQNDAGEDGVRARTAQDYVFHEGNAGRSFLTLQAFEPVRRPYAQTRAGRAASRQALAAHWQTMAVEHSLTARLGLLLQPQHLNWPA